MGVNCSLGEAQTDGGLSFGKMGMWRLGVSAQEASLPEDCIYSFIKLYAFSEYRYCTLLD